MICNVHLDPVWLRQRPEGIAEAISTFRVAADLCDKFDRFFSIIMKPFCMNESKKMSLRFL